MSKQRVLKTHLARLQAGQYLSVQALVSSSGRQGQTTEKAERNKVCRWLTFALKHQSCAIWGQVRQKVSFSFLRLFSAENQRLVLFTFGLTWGDHLLLRTLRHKLADPLVCAIRERTAEGESGGGGGVRMYTGTIWSLPQGEDTPFPAHVCLHTAPQSFKVSASYFGLLYKPNTR